MNKCAKVKNPNTEQFNQWRKPGLYTLKKYITMRLCSIDVLLALNVCLKYFFYSCILKSLLGITRLMNFFIGITFLPGGWRRWYTYFKQHILKQVSKEEQYRADGRHDFRNNIYMFIFINPLTILNMWMKLHIKHHLDSLLKTINKTKIIHWTYDLS